MKIINIVHKKHGKFEVLVDDEDYEWLSTIKWYISKEGKTFYAKHDFKKSGKRIRLRMHTEILRLHGLIKDGEFTDHIDHNGINNQKFNLRACSKKENNRNTSIRTQNSKTSKYKGVTWSKARNKWFSSIVCDEIKYSLGYSDCEDFAAVKYNNAAVQLFGEFAELNPVKIIITEKVKLSKKSYNTSKYIGVSYYASHKKWYSEITHDYEKIRLGAFENEISAAKAYDLYIVKNKLDRKLNFPNLLCEYERELKNA